jgi:hypothetical protein
VVAVVVVVVEAAAAAGYATAEEIRWIQRKKASRRSRERR